MTTNTEHPHTPYSSQCCSTSAPLPPLARVFYDEPVDGCIDLVASAWRETGSAAGNHPRLFMLCGYLVGLQDGPRCGCC